MIGDLIPVPVIGKQAVLVDLAEDLKRCVIVHERALFQAGDFPYPSLIYRLAVCAVNPTVGCFIEPVNDILVDVLKGAERISSPETLTDIIYGAFHFPFHPGTVGWGNLGLKAIVIGEIEELDVKDRFAVLSAYDHMFHIVV